MPSNKTDKFSVICLALARAKSAISMGASAFIVIVLILIVGFGAYLNATFNTTDTSIVTYIGSSSYNSAGTTSISQTPATSTLTTSVATVCSISGQPAGFELRILSDSFETPISGAQVKATNHPALCGNSPATKQTTTTFTTSGTEWYSLPSDNNAGYSFMVSYSGQNYNFTASLRPVSITCATLFIPSGRTSITINEFQTTCTNSTTSTADTYLGNGIISVSKSDSDWNYTLTVKYTGSDINHVQAVDGFAISAELTYIGTENLNISWGSPLLAGVGIFPSGNNTQPVWGYYPPGALFLGTVSYGWNRSDTVNVPSGLPFHTGKVYSIEAQPSLYSSSSTSTASTATQYESTSVSNDLAIVLNFTES